jgi:hypothetical protein
MKMKNSCRLLLLILAIPAILVINSCDKKNGPDKEVKGMAKFSFNAGPLSASSKSGNGSDSSMMSYHMMVTIEDLNGNPEMTDEIIPVYMFGSGFISENIEIRTGEYNLTRFLVIDPSGKVILASPIEGSPLAYLTNDPLPLYFNIIPNEVTTIVPEVIETGDNLPGDFGYSNFGANIIKPLEFYAICYLDNPLIMAPTQFTSARLTVYANDGWSYSFELQPQVNRLIIRGGSDYYKFILEKEGFITQTLQYSAWELKNTSKDNPLVLKIPWGQQYNVLELQPGPEAGKDAMISNLEPDKNFGDYKYFETTFLTEPVLTVMRSNRSLIYFDMDSLPKSASIQKVILRLTYDLPVPFNDSIYIKPDPSTGVEFYGAVLQQVIEPWDEHKVTWNSQPKTTEFNQVFIYPFILNTNVIEVDVTGLFVNPSASMLPNWGMLFRLWPRDEFPGFRFASSDYAEPYMRPKLIIHYTN